MTTSGFSSSGLVAERKSHELPSWGWVPLQSSGRRLLPLAPSPASPPKETCRSRAMRVTASRGVLAPTNASTSGAPSFRRAPSREGSRGTRVARLSSVPSSGFLPLSTVPASTQRVSKSLDPAVCCGPRRFAAFFHAARVPGTSLQSFPFPRSRTRSRGPLASLRVRVRPPPAQYSREIHDRFRRTRQALCPASPPEGGPGRMSRDEGSSRSLSPVASTRVSAPHVPSTSRRHWARRLTAGTPTSKPCSPRESVLPQPRPWPE